MVDGSLLAIRDAVRGLRGGSEAEEKLSGYSKTSFLLHMLSSPG